MISIYNAAYILVKNYMYKMCMSCQEKYDDLKKINNNKLEEIRDACISLFLFFLSKKRRVENVHI